MTQTMALIRRNTKLFFKDKGMLFTAMITPCILLVLYATFLGNLYRDTFAQQLQGVKVSENVLDAAPAFRRVLPASFAERAIAAFRL